MKLEWFDWMIFGFGLGLIPSLGVTKIVIARHDSWWRMYNALWAIKIAPIDGKDAREIAELALSRVAKESAS